MNRTAWLQDRRMERFCDVLGRWERKELSAAEAGEILGCSERQFRRYRRRYEEDGLDGLADRRLGKARRLASQCPPLRLAKARSQRRTTANTIANLLE
jgi:transposase